MKKIISILLMFLMSLLLANFANAAFSCNVSSQQSINEGTNISIAVSTGMGTAYYGEIYMYSAGQTQNTSTTTLIANVTNSTLSTLNFTMPSFDALILQDGSDYTVGVIVWNGTDTTKGQSDANRTGCTNISSRTLDRTKPSVPTSIVFTNPLKDTNTITATINRSAANRCFVRFGGPSVERRAMTLSGSTCTFTVGQNNPPNSDYQAYVEADDRTNATLSVIQYITIRAVQSDGGGLFGGTLVTTQDQNGQSALGGSSNPFAPKKNNTQTIIIIAIIVYFVFLRKK